MKNVSIVTTHFAPINVSFTITQRAELIALFNALHKGLCDNGKSYALYDLWAEINALVEEDNRDGGR